MHFSENSYASWNGHLNDLWTKKPNPEIPVIIFFGGLFLLFQQQKTPKLAETPIFIVF